MSKEAFLREDWKTYKSKFKLCCVDCKFEVKKFAQLENNTYFRRIKIENL